MGRSEERERERERSNLSIRSGGGDVIDFSFLQDPRSHLNTLGASCFCSNGYKGGGGIYKGGGVGGDYYYYFFGYHKNLKYDIKNLEVCLCKDFLTWPSYPSLLNMMYVYIL